MKGLIAFLLVIVIALLAVIAWELVKRPESYYRNGEYSPRPSSTGGTGRGDGVRNPFAPRPRGTFDLFIEQQERLLKDK